MNNRNKFNKLERFNRKLILPQELGGVFLPTEMPKQFNFMFIAEMPSMNKPKKKYSENYNFNVTARDIFLQEMMTKYGVGGSYVTDIVKKRDVPRRPTETEIQEWRPFLLKEIEILQPKAIIVLGKRTYEASFKPFIESYIQDKNIKLDYVFHYSSQVSRYKFEQRFKEVVRRLLRKI